MAFRTIFSRFKIFAIIRSLQIVIYYIFIEVESWFNTFQEKKITVVERRAYPLKGSENFSALLMIMM